MQRTPDPSLACPACGAFARTFKKGESVCAYCGASLPPLPFTHPGGTTPSSSPLRVGMRARIAGTEYVAVGRLLYRDLEGYTWEEWVLLSQDGQARYLELDEGQWNLTEYWPDGQEVDPRRYSEGELIPLGGKTCRVTSVGAQFLVSVEGQIPWSLTIGVSTPYADFASGESIFSVEKTSEGVEWFRGRRLDAAEVYTLFGLQREVQQEFDQENVLQDRRRFGCLWLQLAIVAFFISAIVSTIEGRQVFRAEVNASQVSETGTLIGPFSLTQKGYPHRLTLASGSLSQSSIWVQGVLEDATGPVFEAEQEFWDETGYDDGPWHEWVTTANADFRLAQPGSYRVRLYADPDATTSQTPLTVRVSEGVWHHAPLVWFGGIGLFLGTCFWLGGSPQARKSLAESMKNA